MNKTVANVSTPFPLCQNDAVTNRTSGQRVDCTTAMILHSTGRASGSWHPATKVYHIQPKLLDNGNRLYMSYDPMIGVRTAAILGGFLLIIFIYIIYKAKCRRKRWTSQDELTLEKYRKRVRARSVYAKNNDRSARFSRRVSSPRTPLSSIDATAKWVRAQALSTNGKGKKALEVMSTGTVSTMCNICSMNLPNSPQSERQSPTLHNYIGRAISISQSKPCSLQPILTESGSFHLPNNQFSQAPITDINRTETNSRLLKGLHRIHSQAAHHSCAANKLCSSSMEHLDDIDNLGETCNPADLEQKFTHNLRHQMHRFQRSNDSLDLEKNIKIDANNTSPFTYRNPETEDLKYVPSHNVPTTSLSRTPDKPVNDVNSSHYKGQQDHLTSPIELLTSASLGDSAVNADPSSPEDGVSQNMFAQLIRPSLLLDHSLMSSVEYTVRTLDETQQKTQTG